MWKKKRGTVKIHTCKTVSKSDRVLVGYFTETKPPFNGGNGNFYILGCAKGNKNFERQVNWANSLTFPRILICREKNIS